MSCNVARAVSTDEVHEVSAERTPSAHAAVGSSLPPPQPAAMIASVARIDPRAMRMRADSTARDRCASKSQVHLGVG